MGECCKVTDDRQTFLKDKERQGRCHALQTPDNLCRLQRNLGATSQQSQAADATSVVRMLVRKNGIDSTLTCGFS